MRTAVTHSTYCLTDISLIQSHIDWRLSQRLSVLDKILFIQSKFKHVACRQHSHTEHHQLFQQTVDLLITVQAFSAPLCTQTKKHKKKTLMTEFVNMTKSTGTNQQWDLPRVRWSKVYWSSSCFDYKKDSTLSNPHFLIWTPLRSESD